MSAGTEVEVPVGPWEPGLVVICPAANEPDPCDCGFDGVWEHRWWYAWHDVPGSTRGDKAVRRSIAKGLPARPHDQGWWVIGGYDERCPGCGDIERFDTNAQQIDRLHEHAHVVRHLFPAAAVGVPVTPEEPQ